MSSKINTVSNKSFSKGGITLKFKTVSTPKSPSVYMYIKIDTSQKDLLYCLSVKYTKEKLLKFGSHANNNAYNMIPGINGIIINCPENKITNNILQYITYLKKTQLKPNQFYSSGKGSYTSLMKDIDKLDITIVGKCKTFSKNCINVSQTVPKISKLMDSISSIAITKREDIQNPKFEKCEMISVKAGNGNVVDAVLLLSKCGCCGLRTTSSGFEICKCCCCCGCLEYADTFRAQLKAFRGQFGAIGSKKDAKAKAKCEFVIELGKMITSVKGVEKTMSDNEACGVDAESIKIVKDTLKQCCK
jgi:hypothetical protein